MSNAIDQARAKLIVALDVDSAARARELVAQLRDSVGMFKVGLQLYTAAGPALVRELAQTGIPIFLDLKFHDIPQTVALAGTEAARLGVFMFNVHAAGGSEMMRRTVEVVSQVARREGLPATKVIAVTVLTSVGQSTLSSIGVDSTPEQQAVRLAQLAASSGLQGVVTSALEAAAIRKACGPVFLLVAPGIRPAESVLDDQVRVHTPGAAILAGADYLVVGRPILNAPDPVRAARSIVEEMSKAIDGSQGHSIAESGG